MTRNGHTLAPDIDGNQLSYYYHLKLPTVAKQLKTSMYHLRVLMRKNGVTEWPYAKFRYLAKMRVDEGSSISKLSDTEYETVIESLRTNPEVRINELMGWDIESTIKTRAKTRAEMLCSLSTAATEALQDIEVCETLQALW